MFTKEAKIAERDRRLALLNQLMEKNGLDAILFTSAAQQTLQMATKYITGYQLSSRRDYIFMKKGEMPYLILSNLGQQFHARRISWLPAENIVCGDMEELVKKFISSLPGTPKIGTYETREMPVGMWQVLQSTGAEFVDVTREFTELRKSKSEYELALTRLASDIAVQSLEYVVRNIKPGVTENELIGGAEGFLRSRGAEDMLILTRSQKPHSFITRATDVPVKEDGVFVYSAEVAGPGGYWTQLIRPIFMSYDAQPEAQAILEVIKEAEKAGAAMIRPGNKIRDIAIAIEEVVAKRGYKTGVWSGHGMGADLGDGIDIGASNDMEIVPNMIFTLHPSVVSDTDGLLFGNTFVSTEGEAICLTPQYQDSLFIDDLRKVIK